jgi:DnaK suppressor protein
MSQQYVGKIGVAVATQVTPVPLAACSRRDARDPIQQPNRLPNANVYAPLAHHASVDRSRAAAQAVLRWRQARKLALQALRPVVGTRRLAEEHELNQRQVKLFQRLLGTRRHELLEEAERTVGGMTDSKENFPDPTDRASLESHRNAMLRIRDRERKLLSKIDDALRRIEDGTYGLCESCGGPIGIDRLKARPVTTLCIDCKSDQEAQERRQRS